MNSINNDVILYKNTPRCIFNNSTFTIITFNNDYIRLNSKSKDGLLLNNLRFAYYRSIMKDTDLFNSIENVYHLEQTNLLYKFKKLKKSEKARFLAIIKFKNLDKWNEYSSFIRRHL